jgi:phosphatidylserine decarboxylase
MARDGWMFVVPGLLIALIGGIIALRGWTPGWIIAAVGLLLAMYMAYFFRDPVRRAPDDDTVVVAPADGRILSVTARSDGSTQIDTFLSVFDVHVNRAPIAGRVVTCEYRPGKFFPAMRPEAGAHNERQDIALDTALGPVQVAQIAGTLARRIVCLVKPGDELKTGDRIGMIRFGSRAEVIVPQGIEPSVAVGQHVRAGETVIARRRPATPSPA